MLCRFQPEGLCTDLRKFIDGPSSYLTLPDELKSAIEAITYIAETLQSGKDDEAVSLSFLCSSLCHFVQHPYPFSSHPALFCLFLTASTLLHLYYLFTLSRYLSFSSSLPSSHLFPYSAEGGLAVCGHGGGSNVPVDFCGLHHRGHLGHLRRCKLQPHTH